MKIEKIDIGNDKTEIKMILFSQGSESQEKAMVDLELGSTSIVLHEAQQLINDGHRTIILDMNYVEFIDAEGIWSLQEIYRKTAATITDPYMKAEVLRSIANTLQDMYG